MSAKCHQCDRPVMMQCPTDDGGTIFLCLDCSAKLEAIQQQQFQRNAALLNLQFRQFESLTGIPSPRLALPLGPFYFSEGVKMDHINVSGCSIGVLNTGQIHSIDSAVGYLSKSGGSEIAGALQELTEAVVKDRQASDEQKKDLVELLSLISSEATQRPELRRSKALLPTIAQFGSLVSGLNALSQLWARHRDSIVSFFSGQ